MHIECESVRPQGRGEMLSIVPAWWQTGCSEAAEASWSESRENHGFHAAAIGLSRREVCRKSCL